MESSPIGSSTISLGGLLHCKIEDLFRLSRTSFSTSCRVPFYKKQNCSSAHNCSFFFFFFFCQLWSSWLKSQPLPLVLRIPHDFLHHTLIVITYNNDLQMTLWVTQRCQLLFRFQNTLFRWRRRWSSKRLKQIIHLCVTHSVVWKSLLPLVIIPHNYWCKISGSGRK